MNKCIHILFLTFIHNLIIFFTTRDILIKLLPSFHIINLTKQRHYNFKEK